MARNLSEHLTLRNLTLLCVGRGIDPGSHGAAARTYMFTHPGPWGNDKFHREPVLEHGSTWRQGATTTNA